MKIGRRHWVLWIVCLAVLFVDGWFKGYVRNHIPLLGTSDLVYPYGGFPVFQNVFGIDFSVNYATNTGAAWGMFSDYGSYLFGARIILIVGVLTYWLCTRMSILRKWALALIITGACGNICDGFRYGRVIDMFHFVFWEYSFPVFNIADMLICIGASALLFRQKIEKIFPRLSSDLTG